MVACDSTEVSRLVKLCRGGGEVTVIAASAVTEVVLGRGRDARIIWGVDYYNTWLVQSDRNSSFLYFGVNNCNF